MESVCRSCKFAQPRRRRSCTRWLRSHRSPRGKSHSRRVARSRPKAQLTPLLCSRRKVRTCGRAMGMTIGAMLEEIQTLYQQHKQSCFLYLSSEVIKIFGSDPSCADYLTNLIQILFSHTVQLLRTIQDCMRRRLVRLRQLWEAVCRCMRG